MKFDLKQNSSGGQFNPAGPTTERFCQATAKGTARWLCPSMVSGKTMSETDELIL